MLLQIFLSMGNFGTLKWKSWSATYFLDILGYGCPKIEIIWPPKGPKHPLNLAKTGLKWQKFGVKSEIKVLILPQIVLLFESGGIELIIRLFTSNMRQKWVKNVQNRPKMAKNWKKLGRYPTSPRYNGSQKIFWLWSLCYIHRGQLDKQNIKK